MASVERLESRHAPLDGVRGLAILVVLVHNAAWIGQAGNLRFMQLILAGTSMGWVGVQLFFVLSGFLITGTLLDALGSPTYFRSFYVRRTLRIFPLYYAFLALVVLVGPWLATSTVWIASVHRHQWWYWTYASNWSVPFGRSIEGLTHFWSLAVEEQFYLLWPLALCHLSRRRQIALCVAIIIITPFIRFFMTEWGLPPGAAYSFTIARWDALASGALLMMLWRDRETRSRLPAFMPGVAAGSAVLFVWLVLWQHGFHEDVRPIQVAGQTLVSLLSVTLLYAAVAETARARALQQCLSTGWLRMLGKYSYAIYVMHFPIHLLLAPHVSAIVNGGPALWRVPRLLAYIATVACLSIASAMVSWRLLEKPCLDLRQRLAPRQPLAFGNRVAAT